MSVEAVPGFLKILIGGTLIVHVLAITFKIQHWEGGAMLVIIAYVLTVLSAIILMLNKSEVRIPRQLVITLFLHLILVMNLLATNNLIKA